MIFLSVLWRKVIAIGHTPEMDYAGKMRLYTVNAFMFIILAVTLPFCLVFSLAGATSALQGLALVPFLLFIFYLNHIGELRLARTVLVIGLILILTALAMLDRRTGTEYAIIAIGCCSVLIFDKTLEVILSFVFAFLCYLGYVWFDVSYPFVPDPNMPYEVSKNTLMFLSGFIVVAQSLVFKNIIRKYSDSLNEANLEVSVKNKELEASNILLRKFSDNMDKLVREKSAQLKAYSDAIDLYTCSAVITPEGYFSKVNPLFAQLSGYDADELAHRDVGIIMPDNARERLRLEYKRRAAIGEPWHGELKMKNKVSGYNWTDCVFIPIVNEQGQVVEYLYIGFLITERKRHQQLKEKTFKLLESIAYRTSHKIRGPLSSIEGLTMLIKKDMLQQDEFPLVAQMFINANEELKIATTELVHFVNDNQKEYREDKTEG